MEPADMTSRRRMRSLAGMADSQRKHKRPETHGRREPARDRKPRREDEGCPLKF